MFRVYDIELLHVKSNKILRAKKQLSPEFKDASVRFTLEEYQGDESWFIIQPSYKHKQIGDPVVIGDKVTLFACRAGCALNIKQLNSNTKQHKLMSDTNHHEINNNNTSWQINLYLSYQDNLEHILKGMVVGGSHQETLNPGFVLLGTRQQGVPVILRELVLPGG
ncbi:unnamed protein product, partial [Schistosoma curassoni]|uniref:Ins145_P3_rec domain-containing protein n=1 Tax=Schistosoma curassoni TaxID=6186 RepID=A0A183KTV6_9TREM